MKNLSKKYRCICEFYAKSVKDGVINWDFIKHSVNKTNDVILDDDFAFVYCHNGRIITTKESKSILRIDFKTKNLKKSLVSKFNIPILEGFEHDDGATVWINYNDFDKIADIIKAKKQGKSRIVIHNKINASYWVRYLKIWDNEYLLTIEKEIKNRLEKLSAFALATENKLKRKVATNGKNKNK